MGNLEGTVNCTFISIYGVSPLGWLSRCLGKNTPALEAP